MSVEKLIAEFREARAKATQDGLWKPNIKNPLYTYIETKNWIFLRQDGHLNNDAENIEFCALAANKLHLLLEICERQRASIEHAIEIHTREMTALDIKMELAKAIEDCDRIARGKDYK